ncbi:hypothetical protein PT286_05230 [Neisseriaceae bacterium ESL0693]|nr:hypothetical protein [Neisseriaceae bacterium ESL0693]
MNLNVQTQFGGLFKFAVYKEKTNELVQETDWMHNLVLNQGLDGMATQTWFYGCAVGTDNTPPDPKQNTLGKQYALNTSYTSSTYGLYHQNEVAYAWKRRVYRFKAGTFNNTALAEMAITMSDNTPWNRALITDAKGQPTTLTIAKDEYLDITCEARCYINLEDVTGLLDVLDREGKVVQTLQTVTRPAQLSRGYNLAYDIETSMGNWLNKGLSIGKSQIGDVNYVLSGGYSSNSVTLQPYVSGSYQRTADLFFNLDTANNVDLMSAMTAVNQYVPSWQIGFSEPIRKTNTQTLTFRVTLSWGRYSEE